MHKCTPEEMERFHEPTKSARILVEKLKKNNALMCLDLQNIKLQGEEPAVNSRTIDVMFLPCNMDAR